MKLFADSWETAFNSLAGSDGSLKYTSMMQKQAGEIPILEAMLAVSFAAVHVSQFLTFTVCTVVSRGRLLIGVSGYLLLIMWLTELFTLCLNHLVSGVPRCCSSSHVEIEWLNVSFCFSTLSNLFCNVLYLVWLFICCTCAIWSVFMMIVRMLPTVWTWWWYALVEVFCSILFCLCANCDVFFAAGG